MKPLLVFITLVTALTSCNNQSNQGTIPTRDTAVVKIAQDAFIYSLPLVLIDLTRKKGINYEVPTDGKGAPINQMVHFTKFPDADFKDVVRPNADTYYNIAMLDLSDEAMVLSLPNSNGRYYLMPMLDAWTNVIASPGKRTSGTAAAIYLITGPKWNGKLPDGMKQIQSPTNTVWILGRVQVNSAEDGKHVVEPLQNKIMLMPLSAYGKSYPAAKGIVDANLDPRSPNEQVENMAIAEYFDYVNQLMVKNPPLPADTAVLTVFAKIGIVPGAKFDLSVFDTATQAALKKIPKEITAAIKSALTSGMIKPVNGWNIAFKHFGDFGTDYKLRAAVALGGLGANLAEDAIYPSCSVDADGNTFNGANKYVLHFDKGQTPPVNAFWSLTMYDSDGFFIHNPINRYAIGDRSNLKTNTDGSVDIYIQHDSPGKDREANWLPCPAASFNLLMRMYWPKESIINGSWAPPAVKKI